MKIYAFLLRTAMLALLLASASLLSSCYNDDAEECPPNGNPVTVRLNVSAAQIGDLNGTRAEGDVVQADKSEFINTLNVYIVNDAGQMIEDLSPNLSTDILAQTGDLEEWHSGPQTLAPGTYTVYAFANIEKYVGETNNEEELTGKKMLEQCFSDGGTLDATMLNEYRLKDPAASINFTNGMYIPMSGVSEKLTITGSGDLNNSGTGDFTVYLDRLVSKVNMTVSGLHETVNENTTVTFSNYSQKVPLMAASSTSTHGERTAATPDMSLLDDDVTHTDDGYHLSFYVNETPEGDEGFTVTLNTGDTSSGGISEYMAVTNCTEIPRNRVYPLSLTFPTYSPEFEWQSWVAPIGAYEPVVAEPDKNTYTVDIAAGAKFEFAVVRMSGGTLVNALWDVPETSAVLMPYMNISNNTLSAALMADDRLIGTQFPLSVTVTWTDNVGDIGQRTMTRTYNVIINVIDPMDVEFKTQSNANGTRNRASGSYWLNCEYLNMFKIK